MNGIEGMLHNGGRATCSRVVKDGLVVGKVGINVGWVVEVSEYYLAKVAFEDCEQLLRHPFSKMTDQ
ncbi:hypothetical protein M5689_000861 [Euphorbia peplus]|nr:hypothetical protein M5689_000861 [Euphorbia peplus]